MRLRSLLFAPATRPDVVAKTPRCHPDGVVVDLEDAVPPDAKAQARTAAATAVRALRSAQPQLDLFVRVNGLDTDDFDADVATLTHDLTGIVLPKVTQAADVVRARNALERRGLSSLGLVLGIETVTGALRVEEILTAPGAVACYFGAEDYVADLGGIRTREGLEVLYPRSRVAMAARVAGVPALDQVVTALRDPDTFRADAATGRTLGYRGKLCIHPDQVTLANEAFSPSAAELDRARRLLDHYAAAAARGEATIDFEGQMVDEPLARQARSILASEAPTHGGSAG